MTIGEEYESYIYIDDNMKKSEKVRIEVIRVILLYCKNCYLLIL